MNDYKSAKQFAQGRKRKLSNNTYFVELDNGAYGVKLHDTVVVQYEPKKTVLNTGGWQTVTTKARMNEYMPAGWYLYSERGIWLIKQYREDGYVVAYKDGMFYNGKRWRGCGTDPQATQRLRKRVQQYAKTFCNELWAGNIGLPSGGDCWTCSMFNQNEKHKDSSHILSHMAEKYYVPSLAMVALKRYNNSIAAHDLVVASMAPKADRAADAISAFGSDHMRKQVQKAITRHCYSQLGLAV